MTFRSYASILFASAALAVVVVPAQSLAQTATKPAATKPAANAPMPKTAWGAPDIQGVWSNVSLTNLERPTQLGRLLDPVAVLMLSISFNGRAALTPGFIQLVGLLLQFRELVLPIPPELPTVAEPAACQGDQGDDDVRPQVHQRTVPVGLVSLSGPDSQSGRTRRSGWV